MEIKIVSPVSSRQKITKSDHIFTFPNPINDEEHDRDPHAQNFEFKFDHHSSASSASPGSPYKDSPADHLFRNGILLPHSFTVQPTFYLERRSYQISASRASSVRSKDSLISSRSNSTNSRSSSCSSSARTSLSDSSERKMLYHNAMRGYHQKRPLVLDQVYGSSRRWQFITPMPPMSQEIISSRTKKQKIEPQEEVSAKMKIKTKKKTSASYSWSFLRFFRYVLFICRECHALEPSVRNVSSIREISSQ